MCIILHCVFPSFIGFSCSIWRALQWRTLIREYKNHTHEFHIQWNSLNNLHEAENFEVYCYFMARARPRHVFLIKLYYKVLLLLFHMQYMAKKIHLLHLCSLHLIDEIAVVIYMRTVSNILTDLLLNFCNSISYIKNKNVMAWYLVFCCCCPNSYITAFCFCILFFDVKVL